MLMIEVVREPRNHDEWPMWVENMEVGVSGDAFDVLTTRERGPKGEYIVTAFIDHYYYHLDWCRFKRC